MNFAEAVPAQSKPDAQLGTVRIPELLAPAGDWECAKAAVENGADAIYFGLEKFNARMRANNFTEADLPPLMEFLHARGVRGYVTFNTLVFPSELAQAEHHRGRSRCGDCAGCGDCATDSATLDGFSNPCFNPDDDHQPGWGGVCA
jgi:hypothetical protein